MSYIGHPLIGDVLYGGKPIVKRQALHAKYLNFIHPITQEEISVEAPYNDDPPIFEQ
jgi:23S rRNA pseudouridine1911/1915/1917 synthase